MVMAFPKFCPVIFLLVGLSLKFQNVDASFVVPVVKAVHDQVSVLGETPTWDPIAKVLYYLDGDGGYFFRLNPATGELRKIYKGPGIRVFMPYKNEPGYFLVSRYNQLFKMNFETEEQTLVAEIKPGEDFNEAKCDSRGRLFVGTMANNAPDAGSLYRLDGNVLTKMASPFTITNGMAWSNDVNHTKYYLNDSSGRKIYHFDYDIDTGSLTNKQILIDLDSSVDFAPQESPDGMLMDEFGFIWVPCWNGGRIVKIDVDLARVVDEVRLPTNNIPTSLARGEFEGRDGFYVTTVSCCIPPENAKPDDGKIMHVSFQGGEVNTFVP